MKPLTLSLETFLCSLPAVHKKWSTSSLVFGMNLLSKSK